MIYRIKSECHAVTTEEVVEMCMNEVIIVFSQLRWVFLCPGRNKTSVTRPSSLSSSASTPVLSVNSFTLTAGRGCVVVKSPWVPQLKDTTKDTPEVSFHDSMAAQHSCPMTSSPAVAELLFTCHSKVWKRAFSSLSTFSTWNQTSSKQHQTSKICFQIIYIFASTQSSSSSWQAFWSTTERRQ